MRAGRGAGPRADRRHPARIACRRVLHLLIHGVGVAGGHQSQRAECVDARQRDFVGDGTQMRGDAIGRRRPNAGADLDAVAMDGNPAIGSDFDGCQRAIASGAVVLGGTRDAGTDENSRLLSPRLLLGALLPDRMLLQLVQDLRRADRHAVSVSCQSPPAGRERIAPPVIGSSGSAVQISSTITSSAVVVCSVPKPRIAPAVTPREWNAYVVTSTFGA